MAVSIVCARCRASCCPSAPIYLRDRAARFESVAAGNAMSGYLQLMGKVARAQQSALASRTAEAVPEAALTASREYGMPPLSAQSHERSPQWRADLADIVSHVRAQSTNGVQAALATLGALDEAAQESLADRVLAGTSLDDEAALVPFIGAALQTYFTRLAATLDVALVEHCDIPGICPGVRIAAGSKRASDRWRAGEFAISGVLAVCDRMEHVAHSVHVVRYRQGRQVSGAAGRRRIEDRTRGARRDL